MRAVYPSDITREQFEAIRPKLEGFQRKTKPKNFGMYDIFFSFPPSRHILI